MNFFLVSIVTAILSSPMAAIGMPPMVRVAEAPATEVSTTTPAMLNKYGLSSELEKLIKETFGKDGNTMIAVSVAESMMYQDKAMNYNCEYVRENGTKYSTSCKKKDRHLAWSVDCGIFQINTRGQICPEYLFNEKANIKKAKEIYDQQGLRAWVAWKNGSYKKYLDFASEYSVVE